MENISISFKFGFPQIIKLSKVRPKYSFLWKIGMVIFVSGEALATPCGAAIWTVTAVEGTTVLTTAGCSAFAVAGAAGATASASFGNALNQQSHNSHRKQSE